MQSKTFLLQKNEGDYNKLFCIKAMHKNCMVIDSDPISYLRPTKSNPAERIDHPSWFSVFQSSLKENLGYYNSI
jgi:hypothetical protein